MDHEHTLMSRTRHSILWLGDQRPSETPLAPSLFCPLSLALGPGQVSLYVASFNLRRDLILYSESSVEFVHSSLGCSWVKTEELSLHKLLLDHCQVQSSDTVLLNTLPLVQDAIFIPLMWSPVDHGSSSLWTLHSTEVWGSLPLGMGVIGKFQVGIPNGLCRGNFSVYQCPFTLGYLHHLHSIEHSDSLLGMASASTEHWSTAARANDVFVAFYLKFESLSRVFSQETELWDQRAIFHSCLRKI